MSDHDASWRPPDTSDHPPTPSDGSDAPVAPPPPPAAAVPGEAGATVTEAAVGVSDASGGDGGSGGSRRGLVAVACVAAVALLVGALVLVTRAGSEQAGASSPEEAAADVFAAIENEDLVALAGLILPSERRTLAEPGFEIIDELVRLELLDSSLDLASLNGIDIQIDGLEYRVDPVPGADDMREIVIEGGTITTASVGEELPIGPALRDRFGDEIDKLDARGSGDLDAVAESEFSPILVEDDGRWYLSFWYSVAESARRGLGAGDIPARADVVPAVGADSPEGAIDALIAAASDLQLDDMLAMLDPDEAAALYRYSPLFLEDAQRALDDVLDEFDATNLHWSVDDIEYETEADGDVARVEIVAFRANVVADDVTVDVEYSPTVLSVDVSDGRETYRVDVTIDDGVISVDGNLAGEPLRGEITVTPESISGWGEFEDRRITGSATLDPAGECSPYVVAYDDDTEEGCLEDELGDSAELVGIGLESMSDFTLPTPTLVVTRTDGEWYFSPLLTLSDVVLGYLRSTDAETVAAQLDRFEDLMNLGLEF